MRLSKRLLKARATRRILAFLCFLYVRLVERTTRFTVDDSALRTLDADGKGGVAAFWHGRMLLLHRAWTPRPRRFHMMISNHRDGALISEAIRHMRVETVGADKRTGGLSALRQATKLVRQGEWLGITPDGPKGPRMRARGGAVKLAQLTGRPILPVSIGASHVRFLDSWDRFMLALPFGRAEIRYGTPIEVPRDADGPTLERCREALEAEMNRLTRELDGRFGHAPISPASGPVPERMDTLDGHSSSAPETTATNRAAGS
ncbi:lysophospholipid acyltransferase family protein [Rhodovibrio salinarum]|nr:lysophospholipid acyltransferase family protein [Rhodovibrio salinarum]